jgi:hypothetical protein
MTEETERRAIAFIRTIANRCASCTHRREELCRTCPSRWANEIMCDYEAETKPPSIDYSVAARKLRILDILRRAGKPLLSSEIDVSDICDNHMKRWTLRRMVECRQIACERYSDPCDRRLSFRYFIPKTQTPKPNRSKNGNPNTRNAHGAK